MKLRVATAEDLVALLPARLPRRYFQAQMLQLKRSAAFAAVDDAGVFAVGGLYPVPESAEREAWLRLRRSPRPGARNLLLAAATVLEHAGGSGPIVAYVVADNPVNLRFAEFLGFVIPHEVPATTFMPRCFKLTRSV